MVDRSGCKEVRFLFRSRCQPKVLVQKEDGKMKIIQIEGSELKNLLENLKPENTRARMIYKLRVSVEGDNVKFKVNESTWSPPLGELDPQSEYAVVQRQNSCGYCGKNH